MKNKPKAILSIIVILAITALVIGYALDKKLNDPTRQTASDKPDVTHPESQPAAQQSPGRSIKYKDVNDCVAKGGAVNNFDSKCYVN